MRLYLVLQHLLGRTIIDPDLGRARAARCVAGGEINRPNLYARDILRGIGNYCTQFFCL